uniref:Uncharacterized protein n=1 Tax=Meloidogyne incognita TaxID=6306 RepID=A0A914KKJ3_MELIC
MNGQPAYRNISQNVDLNHDALGGDSLERLMMKDALRAVKDNQYDFDAWTRLLKIVEKVNDEKASRDAYDGFLRRYPYCYGYWKKYADFERNNKHYEKCLTVYERGLEAIPLSVDLWLSYIAYVKEIAQGQRQATAKIREDEALAHFSSFVKFCLPKGGFGMKE